MGCGRGSVNSCAKLCFCRQSYSCTCSFISQRTSVARLGCSALPSPALLLGRPSARGQEQHQACRSRLVTAPRPLRTCLQSWVQRIPTVVQFPGERSEAACGTAKPKKKELARRPRGPVSRAPPPPPPPPPP